MRVNVYSQEFTDEINLIHKTSSVGIKYHAVQFMLHSSDRLHHMPGDDDRSAVTFWLPKSIKNRKMLANAFEQAAAMVLAAPESGLD